METRMKIIDDVSPLILKVKICRGNGQLSFPGLMVKVRIMKTSLLAARSENTLQNWLLMIII